MRVVIQRVSEASVTVGGREVSSIGAGLLVLAAFRVDDGEDELRWMARKCLELRIFEDGEGKMNRSLLDEGVELLVVSQFTLYGNCRKGRRPAYTESAPAEVAERLYDRFLQILGEDYGRVAAGEFGAKMSVALVNDGPVTLVLERKAGTEDRG
jgi:D-tyrosyl-tRNA(Tyr) deacylase